MENTLSQALSQTNFGALDWGIVAVYLVISLVIGLFVRRYASSMVNFIGAGRSMGTWLGIATMTGTEMGLITVMYSAQKGFTGGFAAFHIAVLSALVTLVVGLTGFIVYRLRAMEVLTIPEFYERRFGRRTRVFGGIMLVLGGVLNMGLFLKVGSIFLVGITGLSAKGWALPVVMSALLVLVLLYTTMGGMISVIVTDYIQFVILSLGLFLAVGLSIGHLGWDNIFRTVQNSMGEGGFNPFLEERGFGIDYVIWMTFLGLVNCAIWPTAIARALAMESPQAVKRQYTYSSISFLIRFLIPYFLGICAFVFITVEAPDLKVLFFAEGSDAQTVDNLYAMPVYLGRLLPAGIIGLVSAAMIAAFMSTHDSYLLCWSSVVTQDILAPLFGDKLTVRTRLRLTRAVIVLIGLYIFYWGIVYQGTQDIWDYMAVTGAVYFTGAFALLVGGLYWKRASSTGACLALATGCTAILGLGPVQTALGITSISGARIGLITIILTSLVMVCGSLLFPDRHHAHRSHSKEDQA